MKPSTTPTSTSRASSGRTRVRRLPRLAAASAALALLATFSLAQVAHADLGIVGFFPGTICEGFNPNFPCTPDEPGVYGAATTAAVNADGTGGASPGDVYVSDRGGSGAGGRIQQFTASDDFVRLWGKDVVASGPDNSNEVQAVRVDATSGTFTLGFGAATTAPISATATPAQVQAALEGLDTIDPDDVSVSGGPGDAGGSSPYLVAFDGAATAGLDQPLLLAAAGAPPLSGGASTATVYTTNDGATGFERCVPVNGDVCKVAGTGGSLPGAVDLALNQASGDVYANGAFVRSVIQYSATGQFIRTWGWDVVRSGPDDSNLDEQQQLTVTASGGTFALSTDPSNSAAIQTTAPIPYNASAAAVQAALDALPSIGGLPTPGSVSVSGGPGDAGGSSPYTITFGGSLGGDNIVEIGAKDGNLDAGPGTPSAVVSTVTDGGGYEVCGPDDACKEGTAPPNGAAGGFGTDSGGLDTGIEVAPAGAPNAGGVLVVDSQNGRVQEFTASGAFVRTFGWDVDATDPSTGFEVCTAASGHVCKAGSRGGGVGQFEPNNGAAVRAVAEDSSGAIYTGEGNGGSPPARRVQKFTPAGGLSLTPSLFGATEVQSLTVNAAAGQFRLATGIDSGATTGTGTVTPGSTTITNVTTTKGAFRVGQEIRSFGGGLESENRIAAVGPNTITISRPVFAGANPGQVDLISDLPYTTPDLPFNASAATVQSALNALPPINAKGGSVTVTGGPGGANPYTITFDGGPLPRTDPAQIAASQGTVPLSGGSGAGANTASVATTTPGGPGGTSDESSPIDVATGPGNHVFVAKFFPLGAANCANGYVSPSETRIEELDSSGAVLGTSDPCTGIRGFVNANVEHNLTVNPSTGHPYLLDNPKLDVFGEPGPPPDLVLDPSLSNVSSSGATISGTINPGGPGSTYPGASGIPSSYRTTYRVEYKKSADSTWTEYTPEIPVGAGTIPVAFSVGVGGLVAKTPYGLKVTATKPPGTTVEATKGFTTDGAPPLINSFHSTGVTLSAADLHALINPQGTETTYHFDYGTTTAYGQSTPETDIGDSLDPQSVQDHIDGLADTVYHFRVVAHNSLGTTTSEDQTFVFHPPVCPNQTLRQQTGAAYLPDCRAYELVSPENAGGTTLFTGGPQSAFATNPPRLAFTGLFGQIPDSGASPINTAGDLYVSTRGADGWHTRYIGPSSEQAGCVGGRPIVSGTGYPSTIQNDVMASPDLGRIIDWNLGNPVECATGTFGDLRPSDINTAALGSNAPYLWDASGNLLDRWPTPVAEGPGAAANFACPQDPGLHPYPKGFFGNVPVSYFCSTFVSASKDLNHFVFSTQSGLFGQGGIAQAPGSAYDNDTADDTLSLISEKPGGGPIAQEPGSKAGADELIQFPDVSADGSRILMGTAVNPQCRQIDFFHNSAPGVHTCPIVNQPTHLYMRVNDAVTYDVSAGRPVHYVGATEDATKVYFTSADQLTADDTDASTDLYMWAENGGAPTLTRLSAGDPAPAGDTDNCVSTWTTNCDVAPYSDASISHASGNRGGLGGWAPDDPNPGYTDNSIAAKSGDVYFYSPEQLVAGRGVPGKENLYLYRGSSARFVAALDVNPYCIAGSLADLRKTACSDGALGRLQATPDGRYAAFVTTSRLTAYDNGGFAEMYRYDADTGQITCVSCHPDGSAPSSDVRASMGGRFITDDGRVFFDTDEVLVPADTNSGAGAFGQIQGADVYEFVDGRPQLITPGTGSGSSGVVFTAESAPGLYGVSADGVDVYFGTTDTLVGQDRNGQQLKFYDARTNGGFAFVPPPAPCAAADECHGASSGAPQPIANGTGAGLGAGGNHHAAPAKKHRKHRKHHRRGKGRHHKPGAAR